MPTIKLTTTINAPIKLCFNLARNIDVHVESTKQTGEKAIAGRTSGLIELGETVTWRARHFGVWQNLTSIITAMEAPVFFADEMLSGAFKSFRHEHLFAEDTTGTLMTDVFTYKSPLGILGKLADVLFLKRYMTQLLLTRNQVIKQQAELAFIANKAK
jgi:ligand-binding SRPBCC domain-containing protein